jgi:hypothetical protein
MRPEADKKLNQEYFGVDAMNQADIETRLR